MKVKIQQLNCLKKRQVCSVYSHLDSAMITLLESKVATLIASRMLRVTWSDLALMTLFTRALSSSLLLVMFGVRQHYVVMILSQNGEVILYVTCGHGMMATYFF